MQKCRALSKNGLPTSAARRLLSVRSMRFPSPCIAAALLWVTATVPVFGDPVTFKEVSLLVRMKESPAEIGNQIARRKLCAPLTAQEIDMLRAQGASEQLIQFA